MKFSHSVVLTTFQVFSSCMWLVVTLLDDAGIEHFHQHSKLCWIVLPWSLCSFAVSCLSCPHFSLLPYLFKASLFFRIYIRYDLLQEIVPASPVHSNFWVSFLPYLVLFLYYWNFTMWKFEFTYMFFIVQYAFLYHFVNTSFTSM